MADPRSVVPYHDPYDIPIDYEHLNFMNDANPSLAGLSSDNEPTPAIPESFSGSANGNANILDPNNPYEDPMAWNFYYENLTVQSHEAGPSHQNQGQSSLGPIPYAPSPNASFPNASFPDGQTSNASGRSEEIFLDGRNIAVWPPEPVPFQCTFCQVLREIIHTDGNYTTKLEIHGRMGIICHAILENRDHVTAIHPQYYMFDFCKKSLENVKEFLQKYCDDRRQAGFIMVQDPHSFFYEALCVGYDWTDDLQFDVFHDPSPSNSDLQAGTSTGERQATNQGEGEIETERTTRSNLALQRERAGRLKLDDFRQYFHLPIEDAARRLHLCPTVVKKICRKFGMTRWPHRKIKSIHRQLTDLQVLLNSSDAEERARAQVETMRLQGEIRNACSGSAG
ncbi:hypothetical protein D5086_013640 [Populus alba]|uniref:Uncharacterized protein n=2 Tax=Populus TaxID=3689 RepID=A0ACC4C742_POPAL|nr:hypothetical protein NC653_017424 [Populus alba x Populus x berolinensis]